MPDPSNNSFIPKRGPASRSKRVTGGRRVYIFTIVSYVLLFATLLASGGMFLYINYLENQFNTEIVNLDTEIKVFSKTDMQKVLDFDKRLQQATGRLNNSVSMVSLFQALEAATIDTVMLDNLSIQREKDDKYTLLASIETDSFDSTIFQRGVYQRNQTISGVVISGIHAGVDKEMKGDAENANERSLFSFTATLEIPVASVPYEPSKVTSIPVTTSNSIISNPPVASEAGIMTPSEEIDVTGVNNED
jgi:hypothetical protein